MKVAYVYNDIEVTYTGRRAKRMLSTGKTLLLYEITPADQSLGAWKKWVPLEELYEIFDEEISDE